jgi:hypothetical protein
MTSNTEMRVRVALWTIAETATMNAHVAKAEALREARCGPYLFDKASTAVLLGSSCGLKGLEADRLVSLAMEANARISRLQVEFACAVQTALYFKMRIIFGNTRSAWALRGCFDDVQRTADEKRLCAVFKKRMLEIDLAMDFVIKASAFHALRGPLHGFFESVTSYVRENGVRLYPSEFASWPPHHTPTSYLHAWMLLLPATAAVLFAFAARKPKSHNEPLFHAGRGKYGDGPCGVCLDEDSRLPWITMARCGHSFHARCLGELLARGVTQCPYCARKMLE